MIIIVAGIAIFIIMVLVGIIMFIIGKLAYYESISNTGLVSLSYGTIGLISMLLLLVVRVWALKTPNPDAETKIIESVQEDVENGYKLYIDGQEIDIDTVNLDEYKITIKDDEKIVILDRK